MTTVPQTNEDLALRPFSELAKGKYDVAECLPEHLELGNSYPFLKTGHRNYEPESVVTLLEMTPDDVLFTMKASVTVLDPHFVNKDGQSYTAGTYRVEEILTA